MALHAFQENITGWIFGTRPGESPRGFGRLTKQRWLVLTLWTTGVLLLSSLSSAAPTHFTSEKADTSEASSALIGQAKAEHSQLLAAGFGFQAAGASLITIRTYDAPTGAILSEDSFDVNVKEEGVAKRDANKGRIFAGGIETDSTGKSAFMLRVYDAETGRFLWEGQLSLFKVGEGGQLKVGATLAPSRPPAFQTSLPNAKPLQTIFSVRAVNPVTGGLVWQDQFVPGIRKRGGVEGVSFKSQLVLPVSDPIDHIFDLVVRTYDRTSGKLLWEDSFEELDRIEDSETEPDTNAYPQAIPSWNSNALIGGEAYRAKLR